MSASGTCKLFRTDSSFSLGAEYISKVSSTSGTWKFKTDSSFSLGAEYSYNLMSSASGTRKFKPDSSSTMACERSGPKKGILKKSNPSSLDCFNVLKYRAQYQDIRSRFHLKGGHFNKACEVTEMIKKAWKQLGKPKSAEKSHSNDQVFDKSVNLSESTEDLLELCKPSMHEKVEKERHTTAIMKRLGLVKDDVFSGEEADALKNLLRTLRWKNWNPELYFHIRFFSVRHKLHPMSEEAKALVKVRWHFILRMLRTLSKIVQILAARSLEKTESCITYLDMVEANIHPICWGNDPNLCFDKGAYKVHANTMLSFDAQQILRSVPPEERTSIDIDQVVLSLQYVNDFAKLPTKLQHRLAEVAFYMWVGSKRVILQQGHVAQNSYFVLLGQAVSKRFLEDGKTETTAILRKGDGFGSVALFNNCPRLVTVISQTPMHLLVIPKDTIIHYFHKSLRDLAGDIIDFLGKMWFMQSWPMEHLVKCSHQCRRRTFRRTEIIETDTSKSEWIYVVTRGAFRVYQKVARPKGSTVTKTAAVHNPRPVVTQKVTRRADLDMQMTDDDMSDDQRSCGCSLDASTVLNASGSRPCHRVSIAPDKFRKSVSEKGSGSRTRLSQSSVRSCSNSSSASKASAEPVVCLKFVKVTTKKSPANKGSSKSLKEYNYKWVDTLRYLDVFGLEDLCLDPRRPPVKRRLLLISDDVECLMLSKNFYLQMASPQLRKKVYARLTARKVTYSQVTSDDCIIIPLGGMQRRSDAMLDPIDPEFCVHCK